MKAKKQTGPFLKWAGGKSRLLKQFLPFLPPTLEGRGYVEPFLGSGAVFFYVIQNLNPRSCTLLDVNPELINAWQQIRDNVEAVIEHLSTHKANHNAPGISEKKREKYYYGVRENEPKEPAARAARFIYLNKTCFNGLHRVNASGKFNVPIGRYKSPSIFNPAHLRQVSALLQGVVIETCSFEECGTYVKQGDFLYVDPPYAPLSKTSNFTSYAAAKFLEKEQAELCHLLKELSGKADWLLSNSVAPLIGDLYSSPKLQKHHIMAGRNINSAKAARGKIPEVLIANYA